MSDARLRELERRWKESGLLTDETTYLNARLLYGDLSPAAFDVAKHCGHLALGGTEEPVIPFAEWVERMPFTRRGVVPGGWARVTVAAARVFEPLVRTMGVTPDYFPSLKAVEAYLAGSGSEDAVRSARSALFEYLEPMAQDTSAPPPPYVAATWFVEAACVAALTEKARPSKFGAWAQAVVYPEGGWGVEVDGEDPIETAFGGHGGRLWGVRTAICDDLVPWVLGYGDPVRMRVAKGGETEIAPEDLAD